MPTHVSQMPELISSGAVRVDVVLIRARPAREPGVYSLGVIAEWGELDFEREVWSIPAEKMKMRWTNKVPLSRQVLSILQKHPHRKSDGHGKSESHRVDLESRRL